MARFDTTLHASRNFAVAPPVLPQEFAPVKYAFAISWGGFLLSRKTVSVRIPGITPAGVTRYLPDFVHRRWLQNRDPELAKGSAPRALGALNFLAAYGRQNWRVSGLSYRHLSAPISCLTQEAIIAQK